MKPLVRRVFILSCACITVPALIRCGGDSDSGGVTRGSRTGTGGAGAIVGDTPCLRACSNFARFCGDPTCSAVCAGVEAAYDEPLCTSEAKAQFDCIATLAAADFDCGDAGDLVEPAVEALMNGGRTPKCDAPINAYGQCRRTHGADCAPEPAFDASCAVTDDAHTHFQFCKIDVPMPATCVPYTSAAALSGWYCCE